MRRIIPVVLLSLLLSSCAILEEIMSMAALTNCEYSFHSAQDPILYGIDVNRVQSYTDLTLLDGIKVVANIKNRNLPLR